MRQDEQAVEEEPHEQQEVDFGEPRVICALWTPCRTAHLLITHHTPAEFRQNIRYTLYQDYANQKAWPSDRGVAFVSVSLSDGGVASVLIRCGHYSGLS